MGDNRVPTTLCNPKSFLTVQFSLKPQLHCHLVIDIHVLICICEGDLAHFNDSFFSRIYFSMEAAMTVSGTGGACCIYNLAHPSQSLTILQACAHAINAC